MFFLFFPLLVFFFSFSFRFFFVSPPPPVLFFGVFFRFFGFPGGSWFGFWFGFFPFFSGRKILVWLGVFGGLVIVLAWFGFCFLNFGFVLVVFFFCAGQEWLFFGAASFLVVFVSLVVQSGYLVCL